MRISNCSLLIILASILAGCLTSCSLIGIPGSRVVDVTQIPDEPTSVTNNLPLFVLQTDAIINSVNAGSLAPSNGVAFPGTSGFTWLPSNEGAALANQEEVMLLQPSQLGVEPQSSNTDITQTISSTLPSMLIASGEADKIAWVSDGTTVNVLDVSSVTGNPAIIQTDSPVTGLALSSSGDKLAYGTFDGRAVVTQLSDFTVARSLTLPTWLANLSFSPDGSQLAGADLANFTIFFMNVNTGEIERKLEWLDSVTPALYGTHLSPDWRSVAWVTQNAVQIMNVNDGSMGPMLVHQETVRSAAWSPDGRLLATAAAVETSNGLGPAVMIWDANSGALLNTLVQQAAVQSIAFSPDGRQLGVLDTNGSFQTWSIGR